MKKLLLLVMMGMIGCAKGFRADLVDDNKKDGLPVAYFPIASATINISSYGNLAALGKKKHSVASLLIPQAIADVSQGSGTVNVVYNNPSATTFTLNTSALANSITVSGTDLNLGNVSLGSIDDNTLKVCVGVGAPSNKCNRLYIRVFTLGTATGGITNTAGFINTAGSYGIDVFAGSVLTPIGFNASPNAASVVNAATVYTYTIAANKNRVRTSDLSMPAVPIKADLSNAGNGAYEMNLVVQYALGYQ